MKKLLNILILSLCVWTTGCNDDDTDISILKIIQSNTTFKAAGGEGFIKIEASGAVTANSDADWCVITDMTNEIVTFDVKENYDYPGRYAQIIIRNGEKDQKVAVTQEGAIIIYDENDLEQATGNEESSLVIALTGSFPFEITIPKTAKDWLSYELVDEGVRFNFKKNTTNAARGTQVQITNGTRTANYVLMQYDAENLLGNWVATFNRNWQGSSNSGRGPATIKTGEKDGTYLISLPNSSMFPMTLTATYENHGFRIAASQYQGETEVENETNGTKKTLYMYAGLASIYYSYWSASQSVDLAPSIVNGDIMLTLHDNGSVKGAVIADLLLGFFIEKDNLTPNNFVSSFTMDIYNLKLFR
ncbi:BACON domain-containing protein [Bacteroides sp. 1001136B_160425_E2]|uniref:BACON domain-containing protein n=1 Tax=Bacteroides sp. 1001136B_160425_E2 TaxID=2787083 RepID=UPI00189D1A6B|nr:BACON domain-containing protein [Bacteroides sp. 1001136B_160425_E2]